MYNTKTQLFCHYITDNIFRKNAFITINIYIFLRSFLVWIYCSLTLFSSPFKLTLIPYIEK